MDPRTLFFDERLKSHCAYCGNPPETRDHVPPRILLDDPLPLNLPVVQCCLDCNQKFSSDEEYFACLIECVLHGTADIEKLSREKIKKTLAHSPLLQKKIEQAIISKNTQIYFNPEWERIENVILKLARGHASYKNSENAIHRPHSMFIKPLVSMSEEEIDEFYRDRKQELLPEIGSRAFMEAVRSSRFIGKSVWEEIQPKNYSYSFSLGSGGLSVRMLIWNYLAAEVVWD